MFLRHEEGTDFCKQTFVSLVQNINSHEEVATVSVYQCNVLQYSFLSLFSKNVSYFLPFVLYIILLEWSCRANKAALFFTYSHFNLLFKNSFFHLSHFDSLSLQIIIKKTFSKYLTLGFYATQECMSQPFCYKLLKIIFSIVLKVIDGSRSHSFCCLYKPLESICGFWSPWLREKHCVSSCRSLLTTTTNI